MVSPPQEFLTPENNRFRSKFARISSFISPENSLFLLNYRDLSLALFEPLWTLLDLGPLSFRVHRFRSSVGFYHSIELLPKSPPSDRSAKKPSAARSMSALP